MDDTVTIEFNGETHETTTAEAPKLLRRLRAQAKKIDAERAEHSRAASLNSAAAYRKLVERCADNAANGARINWTIARADSDNAYARQCFARCVRPGEYPRVELHAETPDGRGVTTLYGRTITAVVEDGAGFTVAIKTTDPDGVSDPSWCTIGVSGPTVHLDGVSAGLTPIIESAIASRETAQAAE